jgi:hypothetical protein
VGRRGGAKATKHAKVTKEQIEAKLGEIQHEVERGAEAARPSVVRIGVVVAVAVVLLAYLLGRRRGRRRSAVVEIRRV